MHYVDDKNHLEVEVETKECRMPDDEPRRLPWLLEPLGRAVGDLAESQLRLTVVYHPRSDVYHARAKLKIPGETIFTGDRSIYFDVALEGCIRSVIRRVVAYHADPDRDAPAQVAERRALADGGVAAVDADAGVLGRAYMEGDYRTFRRALFGYEEPICNRVGRWIERYPSVEVDVEAGVGNRFEISDLVEEVFLLAFERYNRRPEHLTLQEWLVGLIDPAAKSFWRNLDDRDAVDNRRTLWGDF